MTNRSYKQRISIEGSDLTLNDLRWLLMRTEEWLETSRVEIRHYAGDQRDPAYSTIEVVGDEKV